jgi:sugar phosphate isomerase/epimerase
MTARADMPPLSLAHLSELSVPPAELIEMAARAGFASVGLRTCAAAPGAIEYPLRGKAEQAAVRRRIAETGVGVLYIEMISLSERTRVADHEPALEVGAAIGATRLAVAGDSTNFEAVAERMAGLCDLAAGFGIAVDLEFMPFRAVRSFADAAAVVQLANRPNAHILVDALHVFRSGSAIEDIARTPRALLGTLQICDAPEQPPPPEELVSEARARRLLPGTGGLPLGPLIDGLPRNIPIGVEVPLAGQYPDRDPAARLAMLASATRRYFQQRRNS